jgi:transposase
VSRKIKEIILSIEAKQCLEDLYKTDSKHSFRQRCKMVLLNSEGYTAKDIAVILSSNMASVYNWLNRYNTDGIAGLRTKPGQGRKPILEEEHLSMVRAAVEQERQRLSQARQIIEENIGKKMSQETLTRFLKVITAVTSE